MLARIGRASWVEVQVGIAASAGQGRKHGGRVLAGGIGGVAGGTEKRDAATSGFVDRLRDNAVLKHGLSEVSNVVDQDFAVAYRGVRKA